MLVVLVVGEGGNDSLGVRVIVLYSHLRVQSEGRQGVQEVLNRGTTLRQFNYYSLHLVSSRYEAVVKKTKKTYISRPL